MKNGSVLLLDLNIGPNIKRFREDMRLTQSQLAAQMNVCDCDVTKDRVGKLERDKLHLRLSELHALLAIFECKYDDLLGSNDAEALIFRNSKLLEEAKKQGVI